MFVHVTSFAALMHTCEIYRQSNRRQIIEALVSLRYRKERKFAALVLALIVLKVIWENTFGQTGTAQLIGSPVLIESHLLGAIAGAAAGGLYLLYTQFKLAKS